MSLSCPLCAFAPPVRLFAHRDFPGSAIYECRRCSLLFTSPLPDLDTLAEYYQEKYPLPGLGAAGTAMLANKHQSLAEGQYQFVIDWYPARRTARDLQVLEVGCGPGFLLRRFADAGASCLGIELDAHAVEYCRSRHGVEVRQVNLENFSRPEGSFDLILLSHVFEHFRDPLGVLRRLHGLLRDDGAVFLELPREDRVVMRIKQRYGFPFASHLFFYGDQGLRAMVQAVGFSCIRLVSCGPRVEEFYRPRPSLWRRGLRRLGLISSLQQPVWDWNRTYAESLMVGKNPRALLVRDSGSAA